MFQSTLRRLTALNALVFLLIFIAFTAIIYGYISFRLFDKVDDAMRLQASSFRLTSGQIIQNRIRSFFDPRIVLLLRSSDGRILSLSPFRSEESGNIAEIAAKIDVREIQTREYENHVYRVLSMPYRHQDKLLVGEEQFIIQDVIAISIVDSEVGLLHNLFLIIMVGLITGMIASILAGYFLAKRSMVPIEAAWEKQQQFVADASHELRSPITGIHSNAELMLRHPGHTILEESYRINNIMKESIRMTKLIASLLTLARSDANKAELQLTPLDMSEIIHLVVEHFRPMEELKKIRLVVDVSPNLELIGDQERLHQLVVILLDNAFKYTPAGGTIFLSSFVSDKNVVLTVRDTGCGISSEHLPRVFDRFFRGDKARSRDAGGTGLGLSIAKWIVEKHRGKITVESELGKGTQFQVSIPMVRNAKRV
jgi:signal transduction histidine kinase